MCRALAAAVIGLGLLSMANRLQADGLDAVRALIGEIKVPVEHQVETVKSEDAAKPGRRTDAWTCVAGGVNPTVRYSRFLNQPPDFTGTHPSLVGSDMGVGLDGGPFGNWYRGGAIRVVLDGQDVFAARPAAELAEREGREGQVRLVWELEQGRRVTLTFAVPLDGRAVFASVELEPGETPINRAELKLTCYPGGFAPAYGMPSHRYVRTASGAAAVPPDFTATPERPYPALPLPEGSDWVFYGDHLTGNGGLGLLVDPAARATGEVRLSNYGVSTTLTYPPGTTRLRLGFFAYSLENGPAEQAFVTGVAREHAALANLTFWSGAP